ncbi:DUF1992 domain-containing protein [Conyzicola sp.]|uniref:DnaJ family domain-containing protein n=1 Tax=Conyzicola sp. TaxID=1969404 RepID=UPI003988AFF8
MVKNEPGDARLNVARYQVDRLAGESGENVETEADTNEAGQSMMEARAQYVEITIQQAIRRGDFDNLPGAGKPIEGLTTHDPDWWIRRKIEREKITGLGPPALTLRTENAELDARIDATGTEEGVRALLDDFNKRVVTARRQLQGGPPVVTPTRDVGAELEAWRERRAVRRAAAEARRQSEAAELAAMTWRERRRAKRARG